jgi:glycosyltransferase involved in cell wall biosynthesis
MVSVVMPMRNAEPFVREGLQSVLATDYEPLEVVVIDDGSTDRSREVVESFGDARVRIVNGPQRGFAASLNTGITAARGDILMECDADDLYPLGRIHTQAEWLVRHDEFDAVCGGFSTIDKGGRLVARLVREDLEDSHEDISTELCKAVVRTSFCTYAFRRSVFKKIGLLREFFETAPDVDFQLRLGEQCRVAFISRELYFYRLHDASITHTQATSRRIFFECTAYDFQRERQKCGSDALSRGEPPEPPSGLNEKPHGAGRHVQGMLIGRSWMDLQAGHPVEAIRLAVRAIAAAPWVGHAWASGLKLIWKATAAFVSKRT